jgi:hypothetical protein
MHPFFRVLGGMVENQRVDDAAAEGDILFHLIGMTPERFRVTLRRAGCSTSETDGPAQLTVWASRAQLDGMLNGRGAQEPLRIEGDRRLLDVLSNVVQPGDSALGLRLRGGRCP